MYQFLLPNLKNPGSILDLSKAVPISKKVLEQQIILFVILKISRRIFSQTMLSIVMKSLIVFRIYSLFRVIGKECGPVSLYGHWQVII